MKKLVLPLAVVGMLLLLAGAMALDCLRYAGDARHRIALADEELRKQEQRLVGLVAAAPNASPEVQTAIAAYKSAADVNRRHAAFGQLAAAALHAPSDKIDPTNPLSRKFMDDVAGAINRREIAAKQYDEESAAYRLFLSSFRGTVAKVFSSRARADGEPNSTAVSSAQ